MVDPPVEGAALYTIGHSRLTPERFIDLLQQHSITLVVDVRSAPYSGIAPWFNKQPLQQYLQRHGIEYRFAGQELGGRPDTGEQLCWLSSGSNRRRLPGSLVP